MDSISKEMFLRDKLEYNFEVIEQETNSYWKHTEVEYGIENYSFENVEELKEKIEEVTGIGSECAKRLAVEAFMRYFENIKKEKSEIQEISIPDFVYRL